MPRWLDDPVVGLKIARALRWSELGSSAAAMLLLYGVTRLPMIASVSWSTIVGVILLLAVVSAMPAAVYEIVVMDRDGRLDQLRLSGRSPARLLASTVVVSTGIPFAVSLIVLSIWRAVTGHPIEAVVALVAVIAASLALPLVALALPRRYGRGDVRQALLAIGLVLLFAAVIASDRQVLEITDLDSLGAHLPALSISALAIPVLTLALLSMAVAWRAALRTMAYPATPRSRPRAPLFQLRQTLRDPDLYRSLAATLFPAALVAAVAAVLGSALAAAVAYFERGPKPAALWTLSFLPLVAGALVIALTAREDFLRGRLDMLRIGPARGLGRLALVAASYWAPFALITATLQASVTLTAGGSAHAVVATMIVLVIVAPLPLMEGWEGSVPATYTGPMVSILATLLFGFDAVRPDAWWQHSGVLSVLLLSWIPWLCALRTWRRPGGQPLAGWAGPLAVACLAAVATRPTDPVLWGADVPLGMEFLAVALLVTVGLFVAPAPAPAPASTWWAPLAAASATSGVMVWVQRRDAVEVMVAVLAPALAWCIGVRLQRWRGSLFDATRSGFTISRSLTYRILTAGAVAIASERIVDFWPGIVGAGLAEGPRQRILFTALLAVAALIVETLYRAREWKVLRVRPRVTA